jgi:hypothetical protein
MSELRTALAVVGIGGWYPRGVSRLINSFDRIHGPGIPVHAWVNTFPPYAPTQMIEDGYDYAGYAAKAFALRALKDSGAVDIGILVDAAFYPIRHIQPLICHIADNGVYFCKNGFKLGEWSSDRALETFGMTRELAFSIEEVSSYCVGVDFRTERGRTLVNVWANLSTDPRIIAGPHTAPHIEGRNRGFVSTDPRVKGHRHDQTALSFARYALDFPDSLLIERPKFTDYLNHQTDETLLVNHGGF